MQLERRLFLTFMTSEKQLKKPQIKRCKLIVARNVYYSVIQVAIHLCIHLQEAGGISNKKRTIVAINPTNMLVFQGYKPQLSHSFFLSRYSDLLLHRTCKYRCRHST